MADFEVISGGEAVAKELAAQGSAGAMQPKIVNGDLVDQFMRSSSAIVIDMFRIALSAHTGVLHLLSSGFVPLVINARKPGPMDRHTLAMLASFARQLRFMKGDEGHGNPFFVSAVTLFRSYVQTLDGSPDAMLRHIMTSTGIFNALIQDTNGYLEAAEADFATLRKLAADNGVDKDSLTRFDQLLAEIPKVRESIVNHMFDHVEKFTQKAHKLGLIGSDGSFNTLVMADVN